jgi:chromosome segregation ATPase
MQQPSLENLPGNKKSSAESPEASGEIGGKKAEGADLEAVKAEIQEKEAVRASLMKSWKTKFDAIREAKKEQDRHKETVTRLHATGKLSAEDYQAELASNQEKLDADLRDAQKDLDLATEYREEIEKLQASIDESTN